MIIKLFCLEIFAGHRWPGAKILTSSYAIQNFSSYDPNVFCKINLLLLLYMEAYYLFNSRLNK